MLVAVVSLGAASAIADEPPVVTINSNVTAEYTTAEVSGTINPSGGPSTAYWHFEYTTTPDDESSWQFGTGGEIAGPDAEGTSPVPVSGTIESLQPETEYRVRLVSENGEFTNRVVTEAPFPSFTTKGPVAKASAILDPIIVFTDTTAHLAGTINPGAGGETDPGFNVHYEIVCRPSCELPGGLHPGGDIAADDSDHPFEVDLSKLEPNTEYEVELIARNAGGAETAIQTVRTDAAAPAVETVPAFALEGGIDALLGARIAPKNSATTYWIEYGPTSAYGSSIPVSEDADAGSGGKTQIFTQQVSGLTPSTEYHFRAIAKSAEGEVRGKDMNFETAPAGPVSESCGNDERRRENYSTHLPECRAYEQVSPIDKNGYDAPFSFDGGGLGADPASNVTPALGKPVFFAAEEGSALAFESAGGFGDAQSSTLYNHYLSRRSSEGWDTHGLDPARLPSPAIAAAPVFSAYEPEELRYAVFSYPFLRGHLAPGDTEGAENLYLRDNATGSFYTLTLEEPLGAPGSNPQTPPYVFSSLRALLPEVEAEENLSNAFTYEWDDGHIALASVDPDGNPLAGGAQLKGWREEAGTRRIVMRDSGDGGTFQLFLRTVDASGAETVKISASQRSVPDPGGPGTTEYWGMSSDGSKVVFSAEEALTDDAPLGRVPSLYEYDAGTQQLTNITASALGRQDLVGVSGVSPDGSYVYFRSIARFHPGENDGEEAGWFVWHNGSVTQFAAPYGDRAIAEVENRPELTGNRVSPDGRFFTFTTRFQVTAYDNTDQTATTESGDPKRDAEVYVYDVVKDRLTCVSCNSTGARPVGDSAMHSRPQQDPVQLSVLNDGRTFFNSSDALVPADVNGQQDVYEWANGRVHLISSGTGPFATYGAVSADGRDVYIATRDQLIPSDRDELADIYDARVDGGFKQPISTTACDGVEGCHGPASAQPPFANPASGDPSPGSKPRSAALEKLRKALRACKHKKAKRAKAKCRAKAKKRYAQASKRRAH